MKNRIRLYSIIVFSFVLLFFNRCKKEDTSSNNPTNGKTTSNFNASKTYGTMTDQDGNEYKTITILKQIWMAENLRTTKYRDGTAIPENKTWSDLTTGAYCTYNNTLSADTIATYGRLYNYSAVINSRNLAPVGWHIATNYDWAILTYYFCGWDGARNELKETGTTHWNAPNEGATNESGFTALPGGVRISNGSFGMGNTGFWWSIFGDGTNNAGDLYLSYDNNAVNSVGDLLPCGFSVRCVKDESSSRDSLILWKNPADMPYGVGLSATQLNAGSYISGTFIYTPTFGTILNVGANQDLKVDFTPTDLTTYKVESKTVKINVTLGEILFNSDLTYGTLTDQDNNVYKTITIGTQTWMAENLRTTKYRDGTPILEVSGKTSWRFSTTGAYCNYNYTVASDIIAIYGRFYNLNAVTDSRYLAPEGWHIPTDTEWSQLTDYLGGESDAGGKLRETGTTHWFWPYQIAGATNETGFTALPVGLCDIDGTFYNFSGAGYWWSATMEGTYSAWARNIVSYYSDLDRISLSKKYGISVRCVKD